MRKMIFALLALVLLFGCTAQPKEAVIDKTNFMPPHLPEDRVLQKPILTNTHLVYAVEVFSCDGKRDYNAFINDELEIKVFIDGDERDYWSGVRTENYFEYINSHIYHIDPPYVATLRFQINDLFEDKFLVSKITFRNETRWIRQKVGGNLKSGQQYGKKISFHLQDC